MSSLQDRKRHIPEEPQGGGTQEGVAVAVASLLVIMTVITLMIVAPIVMLVLASVG